MKKKTVYEILHCIGLLLCLLGAILCGGDCHPLHQKTVFDSWERPQDQIEIPNTSLDETEEYGTMDNDSNEKLNVPDENTAEEMNREIPCFIIEPNEKCPIKVTIATEKKITSQTYRISMTFSELPKNNTFAYLLVLKANGFIIYQNDLCVQSNNILQFSYIIDNKTIAMIIDGSIENLLDVPSLLICLDVEINGMDVPIFEVICLDYVEKNTKILKHDQKTKS